MPPLLSRPMARVARGVGAGRDLRMLAGRGLRMVLAAAFAVLLLPGGVGEGTAMPLHLRPFALPASYSNDFTGFPKWRGVLARFARELSESDAAARAWDAFAERLRAPDRLAELRAVNAAVNAF